MKSAASRSNEAGDQAAGILVDSVAEAIEVRQTEVNTAPSVGNAESAYYIYGVVSCGNQLLILIDVNKMLTREEWQEVPHFKQVAFLCRAGCDGSRFDRSRLAGAALTDDMGDRRDEPPLVDELA